MTIGLRVSQILREIQKNRDKKGKKRTRQVCAFWLPGASAGSDLTCDWGCEQVHRSGLSRWGDVGPQALGPLGQL